jgi:potassium efflux system protein
LRTFLIAIALCFATPFAGAAVAADQPSTIEQYNQQLDRARVTVDEINKTLEQPSLSDGELKILREKVDPLPRGLQEVIDKLTPRLGALKARLDELGAPSAEQKPPATEAATPTAGSQKPEAGKPGAGTPEKKAQDEKASKANGKQAPEPKQAAAAPADANSAAASVDAELAEQRKLYDDANATLKRARALLLESQQTMTTIGARRRALFTKTLFLRTSSLFAPSLWSAAAREAPEVASDAQSFLAARASNVWARLGGMRYAEFFGVVLLILIAIPPALLLSRRTLTRAPKGEPTIETKVLAASWTALAVGIIPIAALGALALTIKSFDLVDATLEPLANTAFSALLRVAAIYAIARAILAPRRTQWRLLALNDRAAIVITRFVTASAVVLSITRTLEQLEEAVQAALPVVIVTRGVGVLIVAGLLGLAALALWRKERDDADVGLTSSSSVDAADRLRFLALAAVVTILGACGAGYVTFANFAIARAGLLLADGAALYLVVKLLHVCIEWSLAPKSPFARSIVMSVGVRRDSLAQVTVLLNGVITLAGFVTAALVALSSVGVQSGDFFSRLETAFYSIKIGDVAISLSAILTAAALFAATLAATQGLKRWLASRYLPLTRLDKGLRNSIVTSVGYAGFVLAASLVLAHLGLGFQKIAIVAGALSVGIGFGLQSIVNNFVSGLILLWERAIRVGDWVVIGDEQGYVKRINVRTTEVETFDRATMIVPNSNLVAGVVKNWLRGDKVGRIKIALSPHSSVDPEEIRDILIATARAQDGVLRIPAPQVMFLGMEANLFRFELWCYVEDVELATRVRSDLHFELHKRLTAAGVSIAAASSPAPPVVQLASLDKLLAAAVATAIAASEGVENDQNEDEELHEEKVREAL